MVIEYQSVTMGIWHTCAKIGCFRVPNRVPTLINTDIFERFLTHFEYHLVGFRVPILGLIDGTRLSISIQIKDASDPVTSSAYSAG